MPILSVQHLHKSFGTSEERSTVIDDISLDLRRGECYGLLGPNGAGKTTTMRLCLGLTAPDSGSITLVGHAIPIDARPARMRIGVVPQGDNLDPDFTVEENLRAFASIIKGKKKADSVRVMVVPGSARVRIEAEAEGLDKIIEDFGAEWRFAGCSMCLGMNPDQLAPGERCASTSNRNFEGRQGKGGRTHLVSPQVAAATAIRGTLSSPSDLEG